MIEFVKAKGSTVSPIPAEGNAAPAADASGYVANLVPKPTESTDEVASGFRGRRDRDPSDLFQGISRRMIEFVKSKGSTVSLTPAEGNAAPAADDSGYVADLVPKPTEPTDEEGGITSSNLATKALKARLGQTLASVPLWQLGEESNHPGVPYIVFLGNVGGNNALAEVVEKWTCTRIASTKDLLELKQLLLQLKIKIALLFCKFTQVH